MSAWEEWVAERETRVPVVPVTEDLAARIAAEVPPEVDEKFRSRAQRLYDRSRSWNNEFTKYGQEYQLPENLLIAVAMAESGGRPRAGSPAGARGLMQFMPKTARGYGLVVTDEASDDPEQDERLDPRKSIKAAAKMLSKELKRTGGNIDAAMMLYNWGPVGYKHWLKSSDKRMPNETSQHIARIRHAMQIAAQARAQ